MTRRSSGESSIYLSDKDDRWHGWVSMGKAEGGRRDRRHVVGKTRADVVAKVRTLEQKRDAGVALAAGRTPTVGEWLDVYLTEIASRRVRPSTLNRYRGLVEHQIKPKLGHHRLDRLQPEHVERAGASYWTATSRPPQCCRPTACCPAH